MAEARDAAASTTAASGKQGAVWKCMATSGQWTAHRCARGDRESHRIAVDVRPAVGEAIRNHLPVDAQVPAGLGTATAGAWAPAIRLPRLLRACPSAGLDGARRLPAVFPPVNLFIPMKRWVVATATSWRRHRRS